MNEFEQLQEKVGSLKAIILTKHPALPTLLKEILVALTKQPENVLLLKPEEISEIVSGIEAQTNTFLVNSVTAPSKAKSAVSQIKLGGAAALGL